jgi:hypothetical protein
VLQIDVAAVGQHHRLLDPVLQLPHVARPRVGHQRRHGPLRQAPDLPATARRPTFMEEVRDEERNIHPSLA